MPALNGGGTWQVYTWRARRSWWWLQAPTQPAGTSGWRQGPPAAGPARRNRRWDPAPPKTADLQNNGNRMKKFLIGIDPGKVTGFAIYNQNTAKLVEVTSYGRTKDPHPGFGFWLAIQQLHKWRTVYAPQHGYEMEMYLEAVTENPPVFSKHLQNSIGLGSQLKIAQDVGGNKRECHLFAVWAELNGVCLHMVRPNKKSLTKLKADAFRRITKWEGKTNEHGRDAAMLVYGL